MTNQEIITTAMAMSGQTYNIEDLKSYGGWKAEGYQVRRGEKATLKVDLWIPIKYKGEGTETSNQDNERRDGFRLRTANLFHRNQVDKIEE